MTTGSEDWSFKPGDIFFIPALHSSDWQNLYDNIFRYSGSKYLQLTYPAETRQQPILSEVEIDELCFFFNTRNLGPNGKIVFLGFSQKNPETMGLFINSEGAVIEIELLFFEEDIVGYLKKVEEVENVEGK